MKRRTLANAGANCVFRTEGEGRGEEEGVGGRVRGEGGPGLWGRGV